jgi:hypothetical protein
MQNAFDVGKKIAADLSSDTSPKPGISSIRPLLTDKRITSYLDYQKIAEYEHKTGTKVTTIEEMLRIANGASS